MMWKLQRMLIREGKQMFFGRLWKEMDLCKYGMIRVMKKKKQVYTAAACILGMCLSISPVAAADFSSGQSTEQTLVMETPQAPSEITEGSQGTSQLPEENLTESVETGGSEDILPSDSEQSQEDITVDFGDAVVGGSDIETEPGETTKPETENPEESTDLEIEVVEEDPEGDLAGGSAGDSEVSLFSDNSDMSKWNGFCMAPGSLDWYYYKNGKVQTGLNDVISGTVNGERAWWHVVKGKVVFDNTVAKNSNGWWRIRNGKVDFNFNGLAQNSNGWWYCQGGKVNFNFTGFALRNGIWFYCKNGKIQFVNDVVSGTVNGEQGWWHIVNGQVVFDNTVAKNSNGWWHIQNGKVNFNSNTVARNSNGWWLIVNGKVDFSFIGIASNDNGDWYIRNGKVDFSYNGSIAVEDGLLYEIAKGQAYEFGERVVQYVNRERASYGLDPLVADEDLRTLAYIRAKELVYLFSHTRPDGSTCFTILNEYGIPYNTAGENIAGGSTTPEAVVDLWMNSEGHRANILSENYTKIGVGCYYDPGSDWGINWVQLFTG